ncbi:MAG TPA: hypothetical protein VMS98_10510 [Thermoanaerobaculia bacterium]|nr:hypothetical protein [Thermoanaerobaculia bacterium]
MAKAQAKKKAAPAARRAPRKVASRVKPAARAAAKKVKAARPARKATKVVARVVKRAKPSKPSKAIKAVKAAKSVKTLKPAPKPLKALKKATAALPSKPVAVPPVASRAPIARPAAEPRKTRTRRPRPRIHSDGAPVANWLPQGEKPRPSSFIPAPPRAEAPSRVAAPPASSDRLIRPEDVTEFVTRTVPVRVDVEQGAGRVFISVNPEEVTLRAGEGIEWDFRYLGGADVVADELVIEFEKPSPFSHTQFKSRKPGPARPHRQLSGAAQKSAAGKRVQYLVRAMTPFKTELAVARLWLSVQ